MNDKKRWMCPKLNNKLIAACKAIDSYGAEAVRLNADGSEKLGVKFLHKVWEVFHLIGSCQEWFDDLHYSGFPVSVRDNVFTQRWNFLATIRYCLKQLINPKALGGVNRFTAVGTRTCLALPQWNSDDQINTQLIAEVFGENFRHTYKSASLVKFLTDYCSTAIDSTIDGDEVVLFNLTDAVTEFINTVKKEQKANYNEYVG